MLKIRKSRLIPIAIIGICLLLGCQKNKNTTQLLPPKEGKTIAFKTVKSICYNPSSTAYSLGDVENTYIFSEKTLTVKSSKEEQIYTITYNAKNLDKRAFERLLQSLNTFGDSAKIDISGYKNCLQYDLCFGHEKPGYRLYVLDNAYWIGTLYGNELWRCVAIEPVEEGVGL